MILKNDLELELLYNFNQYLIINENDFINNENMSEIQIFETENLLYVFLNGYKFNR